MGKKNFKIGALDQLTGTSSQKPKEVNKPAPPAVKDVNDKIEEVQDSEPITPMARNTRSTVRKGKPVTLYLNIVNYKILKAKAKKEGLPVSAIIDQFISEYIAR